MIEVRVRQRNERHQLIIIPGHHSDNHISLNLMSKRMFPRDFKCLWSVSEV